MLLVGPLIGKPPLWAMSLEMTGANILLVPGHGRLGGGRGVSRGGSGLGNSCSSRFALMSTAIIDSRSLASLQAVRSSLSSFVA